MKTRLYVAAVAVAILALAAVLVAVVAIGIEDGSAFSSLSEEPNPAIPGEILYLNPSSCIISADASGASRDTVVCLGPEKGAGRVSWVSRDVIGFEVYGPSAPSWSEYDVRTGKTTETARVPVFTTDLRSSRGDRVQFGDDGTVLVRPAEGGEDVELLGAADGWRPVQFVTWSPDGDWLLFLVGEEIVIVSRDGTFEASLGKSYTASASWWIEGVGYLPERQ